MKKIATLLCINMATILSFRAIAQCPGSVTASAVTTNASCPSNGSVTITTSPAANPSFTYSLTAGPAGALLNTPQSSNVFNALQAGNYTAQVSCGATQATVSFTIADTYTPITNVDAATTLNCGSFAPGGSISITATGGRAPLQYSLVKTSDPNYPDAQSVYSSSNTEIVTGYGTYQARVKDACNQFYTKTVTVSSPLLPVEFHVGYVNILACGSPTVKAGFNLVNPATGAIGDVNDYEANGGFRLKVWDKDPAGCAPSGSPLYDKIVTTPQVYDFPVNASKKYYIQTITACGDTTNFCDDLSIYFTPGFYVFRNAVGCAGSTTNPPAIRITGITVSNAFVYPITVIINNSAGVTVSTTVLNVGDPYTVPDLPLDNYTVTVIDDCSVSLNDVINNPTAAGTPNFYFDSYDQNTCIGGGTTQNGTTTGFLMHSGYLEDEANAVVTIVAGPSDVGVAAITNGGKWVWTNLLPGTYTIRVTTSCGTNDYPVVVNPPAGSVFTQSITATAVSICGGGGSVNATVTANTTTQKFYQLIDASNGQLVAFNFTGNFDNIAVGSYYIKMNIADCNSHVYFLNSNTVTLASGTGPQIAKKMGNVCEDVNGHPAGTGTAYLSVAGAAPLLVEYKLTGSSSWTTYASNAAPEIAIQGLTADSVYDIRVTSCGISTATQVTIGQLGKIHAVNTLQPCAGSAYELALPQLPGASYEWKNLSGNTLSTAYNYSFPVYNSSNDGKYAGTITWNSCLIRTDTVVLNSLLCGTIITLPVKLSSFTGKVQNCEVKLNWETGSTAGFSGFTVQRSNNGKDFVNTGNTISINGDNYNYTDNTPLQGSIDYRLKMMGTDGRYQYSNTITINARCNSIKTQWSVYPALAQAGSSVIVKLSTTDAALATASIVVTSITGQRAFAYNVAVQQGQNNYILPGNNLAAGTYLLCIYDKQLQRIGSVQKLVYTR